MPAFCSQFSRLYGKSTEPTEDSSSIVMKQLGYLILDQTKTVASDQQHLYPVEPFLPWLKDFLQWMLLNNLLGYTVATKALQKDIVSSYKEGDREIKIEGN